MRYEDTFMLKYEFSEYYLNVLVGILLAQIAVVDAVYSSASCRLRWKVTVFLVHRENSLSFPFRVKL